MRVRRLPHRSHVAASLCGLVLAAVLLAAGTSSADEDRTEAATSPKRPLPDYDNRGGVDTEPDDGLGVWTGRVVLAPLYLTSEFLLRRPLGALTIAAERADVPRKVYDFFTFGPEHKLGFVPVGFVEFGFVPSLGILAFWDDAFTKNNHLLLHTEMWPSDFFATKISDRYDVDEHQLLELHFDTLTRPDNVFYGIGPKSVEAAQSRYTKTGFDASFGDEVRLWRSSYLRATLGLEKVDLYHGHWSTDPSLEVAADRGLFPLPFGFDRGYLEPHARLDAAFDSRPRSAATGSSVGIEAHGEPGGDVEHEPTSGWVRYGASAHVTADLDDHGRLMTLRVGALFADPFGSAQIPFTELISLGGESWMYGYYEGRLVGRSAVVGSLDYQWPIGPWLDGLLQLATGNVFDQRLEGFRADLLRLSGAIGLSIGKTVPVNLIVGAGTETFAHGAQVDAFRLAVGVPRSF